MARTQCKNYSIIEQYNQVKPAFGGAKLRIKPYWSELTLKYTFNYANTFPQINTAADILRAHTLDLDWTNTISLIPFHQEIATEANRDPTDDYRNLRSLIPKDLGNRLVVIFTPIANDIEGICVTQPDWLPFVIVDPAHHVPHNTDARNRPLVPLRPCRRFHYGDVQWSLDAAELP